MSSIQSKAVSGAAMAALTNRQKAGIAEVARRAWAMQGRPGYADQPADLPSEIRMTQAEAFGCWRHDEQKAAIGLASLTCAAQRDYARLMAHFARLAGDHKSADYWVLREAGNPVRQARAALDRELKRNEALLGGQPTAYVNKIARCRYSVNIDDLSEKQLWTLVMDIRRAAASKRKKGKSC
jgi:hypothetical protein